MASADDRWEWGAATAAEIDHVVQKHIAQILDWPFIDLQGYAISCGLLRKVPIGLCTAYRCLPMVCNRHRLVLVVDDAANGVFLAANPQLFGPPYARKIELALTDRAGMDAGLARRTELVRP